MVVRSSNQAEALVGEFLCIFEFIFFFLLGLMKFYCNWLVWVLWTVFGVYLCLTAEKMFGKNINCDFGSLISHLLEPTKKKRKEKTFTQLMQLLVLVRVIIR